eukprot:491492-Prymnesium_polylepis.1
MLPSTGRGFQVCSQLGFWSDAADLPSRRPKIWARAETDVHEQIAQLDSRAEEASHLEDAVAALQPAQHCRLVGNLASVAKHPNV